MIKNFNKENFKDNFANIDLIINVINKIIKIKRNNNYAIIFLNK